MNIKEVLSASIHYNDPQNARVFSGYAAAVATLFLLGERSNFTLLEVTRRLNQAGFIVSDSTVSPRLHELKALGIITDEGPKRPCSANNRRKKTWRLVVGARDLVSVTYAGEESGGGAR